MIHCCTSVFGYTADTATLNAKPLPKNHPVIKIVPYEGISNDVGERFISVR